MASTISEDEFSSKLYNSSLSVGLGAVIYHEKYSNKPRTLDDYANSDSGGSGTTNSDDDGSGSFHPRSGSISISHIDCSGFDLHRVRNCIEIFFKKNMLNHPQMGLSCFGDCRNFC